MLPKPDLAVKEALPCKDLNLGEKKCTKDEKPQVENDINDLKLEKEIEDTDRLKEVIQVDVSYDRILACLQINNFLCLFVSQCPCCTRSDEILCLSFCLFFRAHFSVAPGTVLVEPKVLE